MNNSSPNIVKILMVDDKSLNLDLLEQILKDDSLELHRTQQGEEALKMVLEHEYACCLLDIRMPEIDGFQVAELLRGDAHLKHLPILFVTAEAGDQRSLFKGYESGAVDFLVKPLDPIILRSKVKVFADLYRQRKALEKTEEIEHLNRELEKVNKELVSSHRDLLHFTYMASHDLREPIRNLLNLADLLRGEMGKNISLEGRSLLEEINRCSRRLYKITNDFRVLFNIADFGHEKSPTDLRKLIQDILTEYHDQIVEKSVEVLFDTFPPTFQVNESLLRNVYQHLIQNVFDHVPKYPFQLHFTAKKNAQGPTQDSWIFGVKNTGSTLSPEQMDNVFKMYRQDERGNLSHRRGIGLTVCKKIIESHRGTIIVNAGDDYVHFQFALDAP